MDSLRLMRLTHQRRSYSVAVCLLNVGKEPLPSFICHLFQEQTCLVVKIVLPTLVGLSFGGHFVIVVEVCRVIFSTTWWRTIVAQPANTLSLFGPQFLDS